MFEKDMRVTLLIDYYGDLLTKHKRDLVELYFNEDYSLAEIAEHTGLTRQGVRDSIKKSVAELYAFDDKLHLLDRTAALNADISKIIQKIDSLTNQSAAESSLGLTEIKEALSNIIF